MYPYSYVVESFIFRSVSECSECFCVNFLHEIIKRHDRAHVRSTISERRSSSNVKRQSRALAT